MEKLVLRGILYGADRIPDSWFDRIPGNYYRDKPRNHHQDASDGRRRYSDQYDDRHEYDRYDDDRHDRTNKDGRRDSHRSRDSFSQSRSDLSQDHRAGRDRHYDYEDINQKRHNDGAAAYDMWQPEQNRDDFGSGPHDTLTAEHDRQSRSPHQYDGHEEAIPAKEAVAGAFAAGVAAAKMHDNLEAQERKPTYQGYVPYANIYGTKRDQEHSPHEDGTSYSRRGYDEAPRAYYGEQGRRDDRYDYPEDYERDRHASRPRRPQMRSRSYDSYDSRDAVPQYRRDNQQISARAQKSQDRDKSGSRLSKTFDKSQRGLGYSAVGAIAGGIVGSGVGKGATPAAIGAVLGGLGANMFEAKERRKDAARHAEYAKDEGMTARREKRERQRQERENGSWKG